VVTAGIGILRRVKAARESGPELSSFASSADDRIRGQLDALIRHGGSSAIDAAIGLPEAAELLELLPREGSDAGHEFR